MRLFYPLSAALLVLLLSTSAVAEPVTTGSLVREMVDLTRFAEYPDPAYETVQFSSYDHRSTIPNGEFWYANSDGFGNEPKPNFEKTLTEPGPDGVGEYLICDVEGPGAIVRVWTAAIRGDIRVYLDGADTPVYDGSADMFLRTPWDYYPESAAVRDILPGVFYQRNAAYCPMPFAKRCRIVWSGKKNEIHFYQIQVRRYQKGTPVTTFRPADLTAWESDIRRTARIMGNPDSAWEYKSTESPRQFSIAIPPGSAEDGITLTGSGIVERLTVTVGADNRDAALRQTVMHILCDKSPWGQVQSPVGDFFGAAPGVNPYVSLPFTVTPEGEMTSRYVMPYRENMRIMFENLGEQEVTISGEVLTGPYEWDNDRSQYFRARWRITHDLTGPAGHIHDLPYLMANGRGVYVGSVAYIMNINEIPWPGGNWWGEGDEKIFVDGDTQPSTFGTGSEDYYNYAWSSPDIFIYPYCGQPRNDGPANRGFVTNYRWHILDPLPFDDRIAFYMEYYSHEPTPGNAYGRIGYHYGSPGMYDNHEVITREDVRIQRLPEGWRPAARMGAANSQFYEPVNVIFADTVAASFVYDPLWTQGRYYRWRPDAEGDTLTFTVPVEEPGNYVVRFGFALNNSSGRTTLLVNGGETGFGNDGTAVDLYRPYRVLSRVYSTAQLALDSPSAELTLRYEGARSGLERPEIGIDYIWIQKRDR